jgi:hypothetical protein
MKKEKTFTVTVDGESVEIPRKGVTPRAILLAAGLDPEQRYLIEKKGNNTISYRDKLDEPISVHENQVFLTGVLGPVPVA